MTDMEVEHEQDAKIPKTRRHLPGFVGLNAYDSTLNAMVDREGVILGQIGHDGLVNLLAHAKCNYGVKKGRYYFEVTRIDSGKNGQIRFGVSLADAKFAGGKDSIIFDGECNLTINGEAKKGLSPQRYLTKSDTVGVLINLEKTHQNKNTVSLFVNGSRHSAPVPLPDNMVDKALYPHLAVKNMAVGLNLHNILAKLPFTTLMFAEAESRDVEKSKVVAPTGTCKAIFPIGTQIEAFVKDFLAKHPKDNYLALTPEYTKEWCAESKVNFRQGDSNSTTCGIAALDNPRLLAPLLRTRPRNIIFAIGNLFFPADRETRLNSLPGLEKRAVVVATDKSAQVYPSYKDAAFPTKEEGFVDVTFEISEAEAAKQLDAWKKDQKLRSKRDDITPGEYFVERSGQWTKFVTEKKVTDEGKQWSDEDWMLADARAELLAVIHAFKDDLNDAEQPSFPAQLASHYYELYLKTKKLNPHLFACTDIEALIKEHLFDCIEIDTATGLLKAKHEKDFSLDKIFELVENERDARETRVSAGDELSELKFSKNNPPRQHHTGGKSKGWGKGGKGFKRGGGMQHGGPPKMMRFTTS